MISSKPDFTCINRIRNKFQDLNENGMDLMDHILMGSIWSGLIKKVITLVCVTAVQLKADHWLREWGMDTGLAATIIWPQ